MEEIIDKRWYRRGGKMMKQLALASAIVLLFALPSGAVLPQESDYDVKVNFETTCTALKSQIDAAKSTNVLDSLKRVVDSVEGQYLPREKFLDKALYPDSFAGKIAELRNLLKLTYDRVYLIQDQGVKIEELEGRILLLITRVDSLSAERNRLFAELQETKTSAAQMRETIRKLTSTLQAKDRLIFALIDSIFLPYDKDIHQLGDVQKDALAARLVKTNVAARVYDIAADNLKFLETTQLQPKDYANLIDQHQQFTTKWNGLREKINAVSYASEAGKTGPQQGKRKGQSAPVIQQTHVDSILLDWDAKLASAFWGSIYKEFTSKNVKVLPFTDGKSFAASIRSYVDSTKLKGVDGKMFVNEIWKGRIDKEWRDALTRETMLGKIEYAALDKYVSTLDEEKVDAKFLLYVGIVALVALTAWWFMSRKPKPQAPPSE